MKFEKIRKSFVRVFGGNILTENFIINNMRFFVMLLIIIFVFISHRYSYLRKMSKIESLQHELKDARYESLTISSNLTQASRQTEIEKQISQYGLEIKISNEPIYYIQK
ncbi:MAG: FtsL-like putative cell division protein [Dysgonamonadaceae bacterium]|nr:FtsL-like putative cell division protein [Dysgonamonadaceae bacterium]MDD4728798.1 FtsL-like putative cell division protein [Dysgonamonadaceae bacterium]